MRQSTRRLLGATPMGARLATNNSTAGSSTRLASSILPSTQPITSTASSRIVAPVTQSMRHGSWLRGRRSHDPWREMMREIENPIERVLASGLVPSRIFPELRVLLPELEEAGVTRAGSSSTAGTWRPRVNITETDKTITVHAELPGLKKEDVKVEIKDDTLFIRGEKKQAITKTNTGENGAEGANGGAGEVKYLLRETQHGVFEREITLPPGVKPGEVQAKFQDGILELEIAKPTVPKDQTFKINIE